MKSTVILSAVRTAVGSFGGTLKGVPAVELGGLVMKEAMNRAGITGEDVDEVMFGCVLQGGLGQNVARQCSLKSGMSEMTSCFTINHVCGSGLRSVGLGASSIKAGDNEVVVTGGTENMSRSNYILEEARFGHRMGDKKVVDTMIRDGLWCAMNDYHMGVTAENVVDQYGLTRDEQDAFAVASQNKAEAAQKAGKFVDEIVPVEMTDRRGNVTVFDADEYIRYGATVEQAAKLRPASRRRHGNCSQCIRHQ